MKLVQAESGIWLIDGTFYSIQRADIQGTGSNYRGYRGSEPVRDTHGNPRFQVPARACFPTLKKAEEVAAMLAAENKEYPFVVMQSVVAFAAARPEVPIIRRELI